jgi:hypothetical protein
MGPSTNWDDRADATLVVLRDGQTLEEIESSRPDEIVLAWTVVKDTLVGGTSEGTVLLRREGEWTVAGDLPVGGQGIRSLCPAPEGRRR